MKSIFWQLRASADLDRLYLFLANKNPDVAARAVITIRDGALQLLANPRIGRPMGDRTERRELMIPFGAGNYVVRYGLEGEVIVILRVWHSREEQIH